MADTKKKPMVFLMRGTVDEADACRYGDGKDLQVALELNGPGLSLTLVMDTTCSERSCSPVPGSSGG